MAKCTLTLLQGLKDPILPTLIRIADIAAATAPVPIPGLWDQQKSPNPDVSLLQINFFYVRTFSYQKNLICVDTRSLINIVNSFGSKSSVIELNILTAQDL